MEDKSIQIYTVRADLKKRAFNTAERQQIDYSSDGTAFKGLRVPKGSSTIRNYYYY